MNNKYLSVKGAREHNLKNIDLVVPRDKLIVFTGVSGSGKSSLAFNTIYAEGQRRYIESLSTYARQFLGNSQKPDVDAIEGLSPAISIEQKTTSNNPRSTVGTVTEIYDYLRLLYAKIGIPYCINNHGPIASMTIKEMINQIKDIPEKQQLNILSPVVIDKKGSHQEVISRLKQESFIRVRINNNIFLLDDVIELDKTRRHNIDIVIDRIIFENSDEILSRIYNSLEVALRYGNGLAKVDILDDKELWFSQNYACQKCNFSVGDLEPRLFSFNAPAGACFDCKGLGIRLEVDEDLLFTDRDKSINLGGIEYYKNLVETDNLEWQKLKILANHYLIDLNRPIKFLSQDQIDYLMYGSHEPISYTLYSSNNKSYKNDDYIEGVASLIERRYVETTSDIKQKFYKKFMSDKVCLSCKGQRLNKAALSVKVGNKNIIEFTNFAIDEALKYILDLNLTTKQMEIANLVLSEIINRLSFLDNVGLNYLNLSRSAQTLSGGEAQRIRLATQIGAKLSGVLYVLDEPSIGLHQKDNDRLIQTLKSLRDLGNTLIVVEHDEDTIKNADWIVDIGPGAGVHGGNVIFNGQLEDLLKSKQSLTGQYLSQERLIKVPKKRRGGNGKVLQIKKAEVNNLKKIDADIPLGKFVAVTGVSGSGKSSLINEILFKGITHNLGDKIIKPGKCESIKGLDNIDKVVNISQEPIGRTPRSNPATYTSVFDDIRDLFANTKESKIRGYLKGRFSFNVLGGRCEGCQGDGIIRISMHFLPDVDVTCENCNGKRYNDETLQVKYKNKNIYDVLEMTIDDAYDFFESLPKIEKKLKILIDVGLSYIKLGQPAPQLSGGEAQRIKLATYLQKQATGKTLFILDEPTTGLHPADVEKLLMVLNRIVDNGDSVVVIEHNLDVIKVSDHIIDLGPDGGSGGGKIMATGTPEQVANKADISYTGHYLKKILKI